MVSKTSPGWTLTQAAKALGVSEKTVRRRIKNGTLRAETVEGKFGPEYRILELPGDTAAKQTLDTNLGQLLDMLNRLQVENRDLAGHLGAAQERVRTLESQVKLLTTGKQPWWKRLFKRRREMKKWYGLTGMLTLLLVISISTCSGKSDEVDRLKDELTAVKTELNELQSSFDALHEEVGRPEPGETGQVARIGETIPVPGKENLSVTLLWWKESKVVVNGEYAGGEYWTFTAKPGMKFIILAYEFRNNWVREQETPYLSAGQILTAPKGYYFETWNPPLGVQSKEYKPRRATAEEMETLIGDSGGYEKLMPEQSVIGCVKFEISEDATPVEADVVGLRPYLIKF